MSIEFRCTQCDRLLRTPEGTSGKSAKCPQCGALVRIPEVASGGSAAPAAAGAGQAGSAPPPPAAPRPQAAMSPVVPPALRDTIGYSDPANPYQSPQAGAMAPELARGFQPTRIELGETFSRAWEIYKRNLGACIGATLIMFFISFLVNMVINFGFALASQDAEGVIAVIIFGVQQVIAQAVGAFFWIGMILFNLKVARGEPAEFSALFGGGPWFVFGAVIQVITTLAMMVGFVLLIVPGIIIALMLSQSMYLLVDRNTDIMGALRMSMEVTKGNKLTLFALYMLSFLITVVVALFTCGLGMILAAPFMVLLTTVAYLGMTGQPTALDAARQATEERAFGAAGAQPAG